MIVFERRAAAILYSLLRSRRDPRPLLVPANVCPVVPVTLLEAGQPFELVDIAEPWLEIDRDACLDRLRARAGGYAGVLFVRPYGSERDPTPFFEAARARQPNLLLVDDKCLCRPDVDGRRVSPLAHVTLFSTGAAKHVDLGAGGFAHLADGVAYRSEHADFREEALAIVTRRWEDAVAGRTAFAGATPGWLDLRPPSVPWSEHRRRTIDALSVVDAHKAALNAVYAQTLPSGIQLASELQSWRFNIRVPAADRLVASAFAAGLFASRHYAPLGGIVGPGVFPVAARVHEGIVNLFNDRHFDEARARRMADLVNRHLDAA